MIGSFENRATEDLYHGRPSSRIRRFPPDIQKTALRKLDLINTASGFEDLRVPPGNRLEALRGDLEGYYSIRVNDQWRIVFRWEGKVADDVSLVDYH
ncbi:MAG: type II toxin-antitoxin system RelE/ParE family toxin [Chloroflexi bacterium]|nr:type II toxin-antitoxin system RelE/ParE family toxin [Chloroflexota bacterium]